MAAASIFCNSAGVDTSKSRVIPLDALLHFLDHFQRENCGEDGAKQLIMVRSRHAHAVLLICLQGEPSPLGPWLGWLRFGMFHHPARAVGSYKFPKV